MIEHITYPQGIFMMSECYRILKANGKIRISTPNLAFLIDLYNKDKSDLQQEYIKWATDQFIHSLTLRRHSEESIAVAILKIHKSLIFRFRCARWVIQYAPSATDTFAINNFVRDWRHQFIYDEKTPRSAMEKVGFTNITTFELNKSEAETLRDLEHENRMPESFLRLETFTLEGTKLPT